MELILAIGIGVMTGSGVWLILRPRTYQVIVGLSLLSYAVNLFIFGWAASRQTRRRFCWTAFPCRSWPTLCPRRWF